MSVEEGYLETKAPDEAVARVLARQACFKGRVSFYFETNTFLTNADIDAYEEENWRKHVDDARAELERRRDWELSDA